jgi:tetratricopeptide (TPR) repeat protein
VACSQSLETKPSDQTHPACQQLFDPNDPDKLTTLGLLYGQHGLYAEAVQPLEKADRLDPESFEIQHDLGLTYFRLRRYTEARVALAKAVALRPDFFGSNALLGATLYALGQDEVAYEVLNHAHALNPEDGDTAGLPLKEALILANREEHRENYELAVGYLRKAVQLQPENKEVRQRLSDFSRRLSGLPRLEPGTPP